MQPEWLYVAEIVKITHVAEIVNITHVAEIVNITHVARILEAEICGAYSYQNFIIANHYYT